MLSFKSQSSFYAVEIHFSFSPDQFFELTDIPAVLIFTDFMTFEDNIVRYAYR